MLRIEVANNGLTPVVTVAGRIHGGTVNELSRVCDGVGRSFTLEATEVQSADAAGIRLLRALRSGGAEIQGLSPYLQMLLDENG
jgi:hypothetical protein